MSDSDCNSDSNIEIEIPRKNRKRERETGENSWDGSDDQLEESPTPQKMKTVSPSARKKQLLSSVFPTVDLDQNLKEMKNHSSLPPPILQPDLNFTQRFISQELDDDTLNWILSIVNILPDNVLHFTQVRPMYGKLALALAPPFGYSLSVGYNDVLYVSFTKKDHSIALEGWAHFLDTLPGIPADEVRAAYPYVLPPSIPKTVFLPRHPRQNTETYPKLFQPSNEVPFATVLIQLLRN